MSISNQQIHFLTGKLAESAVRDVLDQLAREMGLQYTLQVLPITVAALLTTEWIERKISIPEGTDRIILPGYCRGDLNLLQRQLSVPVERGPKDVRKLPEFFGVETTSPKLDHYHIEIIAEINHVPELPIAAVVEIAERYARDGADVIDLGCIPGETCSQIGEYTRAVIDQGLRVSIDTFNVREIELATSAGAGSGSVGQSQQSACGYGLGL